MENKTDIIWLDSVDSTNDAARRLISSIDNLSVVSAVQQTKGRGQRGNTWYSSPEDSLTFSVVLKKLMINAYDQFAISEIASLSIIDLLSSKGIEAKIKWPNDIYVNNKKICGILIENSLRQDNIAWSIIGIGLNVNQTAFPKEIPNPTSMAICSGNRYDIKIILEEFKIIFKSYYRRYLHINGGLKKLHQMYHSQMWRKDENCSFFDLSDKFQKKFTGKIRGISEIGMLKIENEKGELKEFAFKEIQYII